MTNAHALVEKLARKFLCGKEMFSFDCGPSLFILKMAVGTPA